MAKAQTYEMDRGGYQFKTCAICGETAEYRGFFYPTYMNGDAEWLGDYCKDHRGIDLKAVGRKEIKTLYPLE